MTTNSPRAEAPYDLTVRRFTLDVASLPTHWFDNNALLTHAINAQMLLFPGLERFMIRVLRSYMKELTDPTLRSAVKDLIGQEVHHGLSHDAALDLLRAQGFRLGDNLTAGHGAGQGFCQGGAIHRRSLAS